MTSTPTTADPVDWPAPVVSASAEPPAATADPATADPVAVAEAASEEDDDDRLLGAVALALGEAPPMPPRPGLDQPAVDSTPANEPEAAETTSSQVTEQGQVGIAANEAGDGTESEPADDDDDFGLTAVALALEVEPPFPADLGSPAPEAPEPSAPPAAATSERPGEATAEPPESTGAEPLRPDIEEPVGATAAMVDAGPTSPAPSPELPGVGMVPPSAAAVAPPPPPPPPPILPAAMVATPAPPPPPAPPQDDFADAEADDAGADELLELWAIAEDEKGKDDGGPWLRRRVIGPAAGRWSVMRRGERVNVVLYALTGVSIVAMTLELLAGPDAIPTDVATTPGGSASQTAPTVKSTTTVTFTLPQDTEPPPPVVTRAPSRITTPPAGDEEPASDPPAVEEEEEPEPTPTTQAPATTAPTIPRTTPTTFSNTFPTPVPPVPPTFVGPPVATTAPKIPSP